MCITDCLPVIPNTASALKFYSTQTDMMPFNKKISSRLSSGFMLVSMGALFLWFSSCVTMRDVVYFQGQDTISAVFRTAAPDEYEIKPDDELYLQVTSLDEPAQGVFSGNAQQMMNMGAAQPFGASLIAYRVDKDGYLHLPVVGRVKAGGRTAGDVEESIRESLGNILNQPVVSLKLVNRYVSVLGEVRNPGHFPYTQSRITLLDALGLAGDITDYGNRREIILTRNERGTNQLITLDLTKPDILASEYFYIRPNDIIYVKPSKKKFWSLQQVPFSVLLSAITTSLVFYSVFK